MYLRPHTNHRPHTAARRSGAGLNGRSVWAGTSWMRRPEPASFKKQQARARRARRRKHRDKPRGAVVGTSAPTPYTFPLSITSLFTLSLCLKLFDNSTLPLSHLSALISTHIYLTLQRHLSLILLHTFCFHLHMHKDTFFLLFKANLFF